MTINSPSAENIMEVLVEKLEDATFRKALAQKLISAIEEIKNEQDKKTSVRELVKSLQQSLSQLEEENKKYIEELRKKKELLVSVT